MEFGCVRYVDYRGPHAAGKPTATSRSCSATMQRDGMLHVVYSASDFTRDKGTHGLPTQAIRRAVLAIKVI